MGEAWTWTEDDIFALIQNPVRESLTLDYKASDSLQMTEKSKNEISKDVSAFANSSGGSGDSAGNTGLQSAIIAPMLLWSR